MNKSLTIVLPIHNGETRLRACVGELLELASELTPQFAIQIVDDGSTDATYEVAEELAMRFPQVTVRRYRHRRGLGATLEAAQRQCRSEVVIVHDGVTPLDPNQVRKLWRDRVSAPPLNRAMGDSSLIPSLADLSRTALDHVAMERAHAHVLGFQLFSSIPVDAPLSDSNISSRSCQASRVDSSPILRRRGVGQIPPLPRPKFIAALAAFARGE